MDPITIDVLIAKYEQIAAICALLGGLAFAAAMSLFSTAASSQGKAKLDRPASFTAGFAMACAAVQIVATIGWTCLVLYTGTEAMTEELRRPLARWSSLAYILGVFLMFVSIGLSGWISSRWLGIVTTIIGVVCGFFTLRMIFLFTN